MPRLDYFVLVILLILAAGCRRKESAPSTSAEPELARPTPTRTIVPSAPLESIETLRGWGAVFSSDSGHPDGPITSAALIGKNYGDKQVAILRSIQTMKILDLPYSKITNEALVVVGGFPELMMLDLTATGITDAGLAHLKPLDKLRTLDLTQTAVGDAGVDHLLALKGLKSVTVRQTRFTIAGVKRLRDGNPGLYIAQDLERHEYLSPDRRFKAEFPWRSPMPARKRTMQTPFGAVTDTIVEVVDGPRSAALSFADFDAPQLAAADLDKVVDAGRDAIAAQIGGKVAADVRSVRGGVVTRDVTILIPNRPLQGPAYFRWVSVGRRLYTLGILADRDSVTVAERDQFFTSFQLLK